ncbi:hypothetical protein QUF74_04005 [Candidatus Halobeggiatoa sp. HSG11]|nr:hypothetical protein [Candidatus Halobeggiatoa sp. HSG11]
MRYLKLFIGTVLIITSGCVGGELLPSNLKKCPDGSSYLGTEQLSFSNAEINHLTAMLFKNECGSKYENLIAWNKGEDFMSLGIGHFIWYPQGKEGPFQETFPSLINYLKNRRIQLPSWLSTMRKIDAPWNSRKEFFAKYNDNRLTSLRNALIKTMDWQALFIVERLNNSLPKMLCATTPKLRSQIRNKFYIVANSPNGLYSLIDYVNFKGEGISRKERYNGFGWGLLQVLEEMQLTRPGKTAIFEFSKAAERILIRRINNSPKQRREGRWLKGWKKRIYSYTTEN